jgi:hypothetical protein
MPLLGHFDAVFGQYVLDERHRFFRLSLFEFFVYVLHSITSSDL